MGTIVPILPATETQARPLAILEPEIQREVWAKSVETAPNGKVTAAHVQPVSNYGYKTWGLLVPLDEFEQHANEVINL